MLDAAPDRFPPSPPPNATATVPILTQSTLPFRPSAQPGTVGVTAILDDDEAPMHVGHDPPMATPPASPQAEVGGLTFGPAVGASSTAGLRLGQGRFG